MRAGRGRVVAVLRMPSARGTKTGGSRLLRGGTL